MADETVVTIYRESLRHAVMSLAATTREVFLLVAADGLDYFEVGRRMKMSVREVERQVAAAFYHISYALDVAGENDGEGPE